MNYNSSGALDQVKRFFRQGSVLSVLILINASVWLLIKVIQVFYFLFNQADTSAADSLVLFFFALPAQLGALSARPWTLITYMFLHIEFFHILFNMLWLYWFGKIFLEFLSARRLLLTYLAGGLAGGLCYVFAFNIFPVFQKMLPLSFALGASASVMAIVTAISFYVPNYTIQLLFIGRIKIVYLAIALFVIDFFAIPSGNPGGHLAHIGGAAWGFLYVLIIKKDIWKGIPGGSSRIFDRIGGMFRSRSAGKQNHEWEDKRPLTDDEYNFEKSKRQEKIDNILEKISKGGYDSLTREEKEFLFKSSGKN
jgi:membrane associated rhomboid family serine protease